jgi:imidazolonepropionase-like amidohydrolase/catechol 2,3-dioxygenase-like lactoylglutathione lyase family enzyme
VWLLLIGGTTLSAQERPLVVVGGHYFDVLAGQMRSNGGIVTIGGRLLSVGTTDVALDLSNGERLELAEDDYILPGLFDLHAHYNVQFLGLPRSEELVATPVLWLANGVTSTFPAGEYDPEGMWQLRLRIERGEQIGPRLHNSGPYYGRARPGWAKMTKEELFAEVDLWVSRGVRGFKAKSPDAETLRWLIERAHYHGLSVTGHLGSGYRETVNPRDAILMGIDRIEHFLGGAAFPPDRTAYESFPLFRPQTPQFEEIGELFRAHDVTYDPTISAYAYYGVEGKSHPALEFWTNESRFLTPEVRQWIETGGPELERFDLSEFDAILSAKCPLVKAFHEAGGRLALATDHPSWGVWLSGFVAHREMHALSLCGIPPADVLRIATLNGAQALGMSDRLGSLEVGKLADFFVVRGNPLDDIRNTRNVRRVAKSGHVYDPAVLLASIEGTMGPPTVHPRQRLSGSRAFAIVGPSFLAIQVRDADRASEWYRRAFGLEEIRSLEAEGGGYSIRILHRAGLTLELIRLNSATDGPTQQIGLFKAGWYVDDIDAAYSWLHALGTNMDERVFVEETIQARTFVLRDHEGNRIQLFERCTPVCE